jgi:hypothetical protein
MFDIKQKQTGRRFTRQMEEEIRRIDSQYIRALLNMDFDFVKQSIASDFVHIECTGTVKTATNFLEEIKRKGTIFKNFVIQNNICMYGHTAVITGSYHTTLIQNGRESPKKFVRNSRIYVKSALGWKLVLDQETEILDR